MGKWLKLGYLIIEKNLFWKKHPKSGCFNLSKNKILNRLSWGDDKKKKIFKNKNEREGYKKWIN